MVQRRRLSENDVGVLRALSARHRPMSAYDILNAMAGTPVKAPVQVYRALAKLIERGEVHRIESLNAYLACDHPSHDDQPGFLVCKICGSVTEFDLSQAAEPLRRAGGAGFEVDAINVEVQGTCRACCAEREMTA